MKMLFCGWPKPTYAARWHRRYVRYMYRDRSGVSEIEFSYYRYLYSVPKSIPRIKKSSAIVINNFKKINKDFSTGNFLKKLI